MNTLIKFPAFLLILSFLVSACGSDDQSINYRISIVGEWQLKNAGDLQRYFRGQKDFVLKDATMIFKDNGSLTTRLQSSDKKSWIVNEGKWKMPEEAGYITIEATDGPFDDHLPIEFADERTFYITSNDLIFHFVKM